MKVLVLEGSSDALSKAASREGLDASAVRTAADAAAACATARFDLVLIERDQPGAAELCRELRAVPALAGAFVLVLVAPAGDEAGTTRELLEAGATDVLVGPAGEARIEARLAVASASIRAREHDRRNELRLETTLDSIAEGVVATDVDGKVFGMNPMAESLTGWALEEARGRQFADVCHLVHEDGIESAEALLGRVLAEGETVRRTRHAMLVAKDGNTRPIAETVAPIRDAAAAIRGAVGIFRDTSEERRAEEALVTAQTDFRRIIERTSDGIAIRRGDRLAYVNASFVASLGHDGPDDLVGKPLLDFIHPSDRRAVEDQMRLMDELRHVPPMREVRMLRRDGETVTFEISPVQRVEFEGKRGFLTVARDVTARKRIQGQLVLADRLASVGTLAAGVAHEINNPLAYVVANVGYSIEECDKIRRAGVEADRLAAVVEALEEARTGAERMRLVVHDLRSFARPGHGERQHGAVEIARVLESAVRIVGNELRHRARIVRDYGETPLVEADEARLGQVFVNLLVNAAQAMPEGDASRNEVRVSTRADGNGRAVAEVRDTGPGIPPDILTRIFDPFFTTKPVGTGTGLGLSVCHGIVTSLGGEIAVESEVGHGTTFRVLLPAARIATPAGAGEAGAALRGRILIVDDEPMIGTALQRLLSPEHDVVVVTSAKDALEQIATTPPFDVILCDLMMPDMTGMDLHEELSRTRPDHLDRMIFFTGGAFTPRASSFLESVPNPRLQKPFDLPSLRALLAERLKRSRELAGP